MTEEDLKRWGERLLWGENLTHEAQSRLVSAVRLLRGNLEIEEKANAYHRRQRDDARELAAMYLQCLNSRALESGESVEARAKFCEAEFAENEWLKAEYQKLVEAEADVARFVREAELKL